MTPAAKFPATVFQTQNWPIQMWIVRLYVSRIVRETLRQITQVTEATAPACRSFFTGGRLKKVLRRHHDARKLSTKSHNKCAKRKR